MRIDGISRDGGGKKVELIDWEHSSIDTATDDLADMMAMLWHPDLRPRIELALPNLYHTTLLISVSSDEQRRSPGLMEQPRAHHPGG
jgi:hypothetical protein